MEEAAVVTLAINVNPRRQELVERWKHPALVTI